MVRYKLIFYHVQEVNRNTVYKTDTDWYFPRMEKCAPVDL